MQLPEAYRQHVGARALGVSVSGITLSWAPGHLIYQCWFHLQTALIYVRH